MLTNTHTRKTAVKIESLTPLMQQYHSIKQNYPNSILFFRLGDFYEMFGEDAVKASPLLEIVLTRRQDVPMCGVPFHSVTSYIAKLIKKGHSVAICEQMEDPSQAKGVVKREVIRVITPGTILEDNLLKSNQNNYLLAAFQDNGKSAIAYVDVSTGEFTAAETELNINSQEVQSEIARIKPQEFLIPASMSDTAFHRTLNNCGKPFRLLDDWYFDGYESESKILKTFGISSLKSFGLDKYPAAVKTLGAILKYVEETQKDVLDLLKTPRVYSIDEHLILDENAISSLDLDSLFETINKTVTPMGSRLLRNNLFCPLTNTNKIIQRLDAVNYFFENGLLRRNITELLKNICDIERILTRLSSGLAIPRELVALKNTLHKIPAIKSAFQNTQDLIAEDTEKLMPEILRDACSNIIFPKDIAELIGNSISEAPGVDIRKGSVIKRGFNKELDELREIASGGKSYIAGIEQRERARTGINSLRVGYTAAFGYYIEVTKPNLDKVPADFIRKQTLVNAERFITDELKEYESRVLTAEEKSLRLEKEIFDSIKNEILQEKEILQALATALAEIDLFSSQAAIAKENNYIKPIITDEYEISIKDGRHPVVEKSLSGKSFVPNDLYLDGKESQIIILTGPNMAGKSTYLRQNALIVIMAQSGMFVPAAELKIGIVDRIFTRIGAADNISGGDSTFMVEMRETANILHNLTPRSLLILDEVGRGTSTYDGISIAWSVIEYLTKTENKNADTPLAKVLFATHYFELTELAKHIKGVQNFNVSVKEWKNQVTFLYKIIPGSSDRSYGIYVAKLAGLPETVIKRAYQLLSAFEKKEIETVQPEYVQIELPSEIRRDLDKLDPDNLTPMEALLALHQLKERYKK